MKEVFIYAGGVVLAVLLVCVIGRLMARKKHIVLSSVSGVAALVVINLTAGITGVGLGIRCCPSARPCFWTARRRCFCSEIFL